MSERAALELQGNVFWHADRGRLLLVLAFIALVTSVVAAVVVTGEARRTAPRFSPAPVFPGLEAKLGDAATIAVASPEGHIEIHRADGGQWVVPSASNYPAHVETVRKMLFGLASFRAVEARTARHDWLATLDLIAPGEGGKATEIRVSDAKGTLVAGLLVGKLRPAGGLTGGDAFYARRLGEDQSFLAEGDLPLDITRSSWLDPTIVDFPRDRVSRVTLMPTTGPSFSISRANTDVENFALDTVPKGRSMVSETAANSIGAALSDFTLEDVRPRAEVDFAKAARAVFETFDGLAITVEATDVKDEHWVRLTAASRSASAQAASAKPADAKTPDIAAEAAAINARVGAWAYKVADWKAALFSRSLDSLLAEPKKASESSKP
jgi:hypothetical protein